MKYTKSSVFTQLALAATLVCSSALQAAPFNFHVDLNTSALIGVANSPFLLDFQLNEGSGALANQVTLSNFSFTSGSATGVPTLLGSVSGSLGSTVTLNDSPASPFNEFFQSFANGTTSIHFDVSLSQNIPGATPDGFFVGILDSELGFPQLFTNAPDTLSLITLNLSNSNALSDIGTYHTTIPAGVTAQVSPIAAASAVPEPASITFAFVGILGLLIVYKRAKTRLNIGFQV
jgi:hypothetical protein